MRRPSKWMTAGLTALVALGVVSALAAPTFGRTSLDPDAATPGGTRALAELLRGQGVTVERTTDVERAMATGSSTTLVVAYPELLRSADVHRLERLSADVVLLGPVAAGSGYLGVAPSVAADVEVRQPLCDLAAATSSGDARTGGVGFTVTTSQAVDDGLGGTTECFPDGGSPTVVQRVTTGGAEHTVLGSAEFMTNEWIDEAGNASLAMNLTGQQVHFGLVAADTELHRTPVTDEPSPGRGLASASCRCGPCPGSRRLARPQAGTGRRRAAPRRGTGVGDHRRASEDLPALPHARTGCVTPASTNHGLHRLPTGATGYGVPRGHRRSRSQQHGAPGRRHP